MFLFWKEPNIWKHFYFQKPSLDNWHLGSLTLDKDFRIGSLDFYQNSGPCLITYWPEHLKKTIFPSPNVFLTAEIRSWMGLEIVLLLFFYCICNAMVVNFFFIFCSKMLGYMDFVVSCTFWISLCSILEWWL